MRQKLRDLATESMLTGETELRQRAGARYVERGLTTTAGALTVVHTMQANRRGAVEPMASDKIDEVVSAVHSWANKLEGRARQGLDFEGLATVVNAAGSALGVGLSAERRRLWAGRDVMSLIRDTPEALTLLAIRDGVSSSRVIAIIGIDERQSRLTWVDVRTPNHYEMGGYENVGDGNFRLVDFERFGRVEDVLQVKLT
jgi:hypothetical protein